MGFWIFMLIMVLLVPLTMLGFGILFIKKPPKKINCLYGYRTAMSMKNDDTWKFAHNYCGKIWFSCGITLLIVSSLAFVVPTIIFDFALAKSGMIGGIILVVQVIPLLASIIPVESALNKTFDKLGERK
ncbi:MAG: SdpI family protein [Clostridia bacterium]